MQYPIKEIFRSVQGEGPSAGADSVFVRFAGCNLHCSFCDEDQGNSKTMDQGDIVEAIVAALDVAPNFGGMRIVLTGGEPLLWVDRTLVQLLLDHGFRLCIETNGAAKTESDMKLGALELLSFHELVVSPKDGAVPSEVILAAATAVKILIDEENVVAGKWIDTVNGALGKWRPREQQIYRFLQPITPKPGNNTVDIRGAARRAVLFARRLQQNHGNEWRVLPQTHVWMGLQ